MTDLTLQKNQIRQQLRAVVKGLSEARRQGASFQARALLRDQVIWKRARSVLFYAPIQSEVDIFPLIDDAIAQNKAVALPRYIPATKTYGASELRNVLTDCTRGKFGILEPNENCPTLTLNHLDLILVPGVGFDVAGHRLGRGKGFYDRLLAQVSGFKCGIAFDEQLITHIPAELHDITLDCILTPTRWLEITQ